MAEFTANYNTLFQILVKRHYTSWQSEQHKQDRYMRELFPTFAYLKSQLITV